MSSSFSALTRSRGSGLPSRSAIVICGWPCWMARRTSRERVAGQHAHEDGAGGLAAPRPADEQAALARARRSAAAAARTTSRTGRWAGAGRCRRRRSGRCGAPVVELDVVVRRDDRVVDDPEVGLPQLLVERQRRRGFARPRRRRPLVELCDVELPLRPRQRRWPGGRLAHLPRVVGRSWLAQGLSILPTVGKGVNEETLIGGRRGVLDVRQPCVRQSAARRSAPTFRPVSGDEQSRDVPSQGGRDRPDRASRHECRGGALRAPKRRPRAPPTFRPVGPGEQGERIPNARWPPPSGGPLVESRVSRLAPSGGTRTADCESNDEAQYPSRRKSC